MQGSVTVNVMYGSQSEKLPLLLVVAGNGPSLGRDWLQKIRLDWRALHHQRTPPPTKLQTILEVFKNELG